MLVVIFPAHCSSLIAVPIQHYVELWQVSEWPERLSLENFRFAENFRIWASPRSKLVTHVLAQTNH